MLKHFSYVRNLLQPWSEETQSMVLWWGWRKNVLLAGPVRAEPHCLRDLSRTSGTLNKRYAILIGGKDLLIKRCSVASFRCSSISFHNPVSNCNIMNQGTMGSWPDGSMEADLHFKEKSIVEELNPGERARILRKLDWHLLPFVSLLYMLSFLWVSECPCLVLLLILRCFRDRSNIGRLRDVPHHVNHYHGLKSSLRKCKGRWHVYGLEPDWL
jgi:hypothetical protein